MKILKYILLTLIFICTAFGQSFGKNKVQYQSFDWSYIQTSHFDIYFYGDNQDLAEFTSKVSEDAYAQISTHLSWDLRKRVSILVYNSHNEFQQTNVIGTYMSEGIGGVTELFKNRIVFPFDGNFEQFRHVIHHELVHAMLNDMVYGGTAQNMMASRTKVRIPLWSNEGLAEFLSSNWDTKADMVLRDIAVHERMPTINELNYFMAYKGGQSLWRFIAGKYGREKVGEVFRSMKKAQSAEKGYRLALGMKWKELSDQWHKYLKKEYWPDIANRDPLEDMSEKLTDHKKNNNFYNVSPSISPDGSTVALLSDRSGYFDVYLLDVLTGKKKETLIKGSRSVDFEELKWLQPGLSWSPDGEKIVLAVKAGATDALHIVNIKSKKSKKIPIDLDGVFSASWSPSGKEIAFIGNHNGSSDLYIYDLDKEEYRQVTNDIFSDSYPNWNNKGNEIVFVSDRGDYVDGKYTGRMEEHDYGQTDIYIVNTQDNRIRRVTNTPDNENHPIWANTEETLFYTSDYNGVHNLYKHSLEGYSHSGDKKSKFDSYAITNVLTGLQQPTISGDDNMLIFAGYSGLGWDLYSLNKPSEMSAQEVTHTQYIKTRSQEDLSVADIRDTDKIDRMDMDSKGTYSKWIFAQGYENFNYSIADNNPKKEIVISDTLVDGIHVPKAYKTRFTLDMVSGNLQISNVFGATGMTYFAFSDILGNHQIQFGTEMVLTLEDSDYFLSYGYLKNKTDYYFVGFQTADFFQAGYYSLGKLRHYGLQSYVSHPFSRFQRIDFGLTWHNISYDILDRVINTLTGQEELLKRPGSTKFTTILPTMSWVIDNSVFGITGPIDGYRQNISITASPGGKDNFSFQTTKVDARKYLRFGRDYTLALRGFFGRSQGNKAQKFFLGGIPYLLHGSGETNGIKDQSYYRSVLTDTSNSNLITDVYFTEYAFPMRGARFAERIGTHAALFNFEVRFPFINYLALGFPLKLVFGNIRGHAFMDIGAAWDNYDEFSSTMWPGKYGTNNSGNFSPWVVTSGLGVKINLGYFLLRIESAWDKNPSGYSKPQWYLSLGPDW
jgi:Tol biopolymer transport system component